MKLNFFLTIAIVARLASAHYIFTDLLIGNRKQFTSHKDPVRWARDVLPLKDVKSKDVTCNILPRGLKANATVAVKAGDGVGFQVIQSEDERYVGYWYIVHPGPASFYLGRVPPGETAESWDGSGTSWFKIDEFSVDQTTWSFAAYDSWYAWGKSELFTTIPADTQSGEYLLRIEHIALHDIDVVPELYVSCAQIRIIDGGSGSPPNLVSIPGYIASNDPGLIADIHDPNMKSYTAPGPPVWRGD
ncbi:glycosyl hydrolase family 61-domain-containing protein [Ephemerocybe angulata]|uniref:lytic cellulose monooxygenase (C4-dehydrogenating) n=1 Tax=Ephemerocybe angulata TaxID=980116 RepID=A0A8H6HRH4_9AGAR|nr:glycosyl hydrolase family 61-domain-containing protein [Tulosesus angulatus]KAF6751830.1 glycosyl hydrolase family 61-domain-containing protein [Tulosesus angulatus]